MTTPYDVTYRGMWPSELLNGKVRTCLEQLRAAALGVRRGEAVFECTAAAGLLIRLRAESGGRWCAVRRSLPSAADPFAVLAEIEAGFDDVGRELAALPPVRLSA